MHSSAGGRLMNEQTDLLIAGCGYLGLRVAHNWLEQGHSVSALTRSDARAEEFRAAGMHPVVTDLSSPDSVSDLPAAKFVLWSVGFDRNAGVSREAIWNAGLTRFLEALPNSPERFVYVSSTSVYGAGDGRMVSESTPVSPVTEGGKSCAEAEERVRRFFDQTSTASHILRLAGIYGPGRLLRRIQDLKDRVPLPGDPDSLLNLIHVDDAVQLVRHIMTRDSVPQILNGVAPQPVSRRNYYGHLASLTGYPEPVFDTEQSPRRGGNRRVISEHHQLLEPAIKFPDCLAGLQDAVNRSAL